MRVPMQVTGLTVDPVNNAPIVVLREVDAPNRVLPIWIGVVEASAIAFELERIKLTRPMTHDLIKLTIESLGGRIDRVEIADLRESTYFARLVLMQAQNGVDRQIEIDARPSDAIALALRAKAPILCETSVLEQATDKKASGGDEPVEAREAPAPQGEAEVEVDSGPRPLLQVGDPGSLHDVLERLRPEDFGKYKM